MPQDHVTTFFAWNAVFHIGLLVLAACFVVILRGWTMRIHGAMFDVDTQFLARAYFAYLAVYKIFVLVFVLVPYLVLRFVM